MTIAFWLRLGEGNETQLRTLIEDLACTHGTPRFEPHLAYTRAPAQRPAILQ